MDLVIPCGKEFRDGWVSPGLSLSDEPVDVAVYSRPDVLTADSHGHSPFNHSNTHRKPAPSDELTPSDHLPPFALACRATTTAKIWEAAGLVPDVETRELSTRVGHRRHIHRIDSMKLDLPVLQSDPLADLRAFHRRAAAARTVHLQGHHLPLEPADDEKDEGLSFPDRVRRLDERITTSVINADIESSEAAIQYLATILRQEETLDDIHHRIFMSHNIQKILRKQLSPPISPNLPSHQEAFIPNEESCIVPSPSDISSQTGADLHAIEKRLLNQEANHGHESWLDDTLLLEEINQLEADIMRIPRRTTPDLEIETPPVLETPCSPCDIRESRDTVNVISDDDELDQALQDTANKVSMERDQGKPQPITATKVPVPMRDVSIPEPEWHDCRHDPQHMFAWIRQHNWYGFEPRRWPINRAIESGMVWLPWMQHNSPSVLEETIDGGCATNTLLAYPPDSEVPNSSDLVWKQPGIAVLRDDEEEEDEDSNNSEDNDDAQPKFSLEKMPSPKHSDLMAAVKKRKRILDDENRNEGNSAGSFEHSSQSGNGSATGGLLVVGEQGMTSKLLDNYMALHAPKKVKPTRSSFFGTSKTATAQIINRPKEPSPPTAVAPPQTALPSIPAPRICPPEGPFKMIVSVSTPRGVLRHLQALLPAAELIDRDYSAYNPSIWLPGSVRRSEVTTPMADEADIIVAPSTGVLLTTMIKVRQKPLPGTKGNSPLYSHVEKASVRYERIIVLVSEGAAFDDMETASLSSADANSLVKFQGFVASLETQGTALYVPGGQQNLAAWIASLSCRYAANALAQSHLLQPESRWELFLRRAGMNVAAAQVVLGMLKELPSIVVGGEHFRGLPALVRMSSQERVARFGSALGGTRVLQRVGRVIDGRWDLEVVAAKGAAHAQGISGV